MCVCRWIFWFRHDGCTAGILKLVCGGIGELVTPWCQHVVLRLPSILQSNMMLAAAGILFYAVPLSLVYYPLGGFSRARKVKQKQLQRRSVLAMAESVTTLSHRARLRRSIALFGTDVDGDMYKRMSEDSKAEVMRRRMQPRRVSRRGESHGANYMAIV